jgi:Protein of unknown function (DUF1570)
MRRFGLALALTFLAGGLARAEYIVIIYKLGVKQEVSGGFPGGTIGGMLPGGMGGYAGGMPGYPGGAGGMPGYPAGGGAGGMVPPGGAGGGFIPPGGAGGGKFSGGAGGVPPGVGGGVGGAPIAGGAGGGPPIAGGVGGAPPIAGGGPPMGGGAPMGGYPAGLSGVSGGGPPMGGSGSGPPMGGYPAGLSGVSGGATGNIGGSFGGIGGINLPSVTYTPVYAVAVLDTGNAKLNLTTAPGYAYTGHKWGSVYLPLTNPSVRLLKDPALAPASTRFEKESNKIRDSHKDKDGKVTAEGLVKLAEWALHHGLRDKFEETMDELVKLEAKSENPHPAAKAYKTIKAEMARKITKPDPIENLSKSVLSEYKPVQGEHYVLLHNMDAKEKVPAEVESRLRKLESNYRNFYYWFALKGVVPKVPDERLVAVLVGGTNQDQFNRQRKIFDDQPLVVDGFLARSDNVVVLANHRLDSSYSALVKNTEKYWAVVPQDSILKKLPKDQPIANAAEAQTVALLLKLMEEDSETAAVSYEGTRQLLQATGYLPKNVATPTWLQFGLGSFFETPKGSIWTTVGVPGVTLDQEANYLTQYKKFASDEKVKLEKSRGIQLKKVITDQYWHDSEKLLSSDLARNKARALSWALTYYLMNNKLEGLKRYQEELSKLPRDLEFDADTLILCFARAFDLLDARDPNKVDEGKLSSLADKWHDVIDATNSEVSASLQEQLEKELNAMKTGGGVGGGTNPGGIGPGGRPGIPGGGPGIPGGGPGIGPGGRPGIGGPGGPGGSGS